jgi:hypothetical protein
LEIFGKKLKKNNNFEKIKKLSKKVEKSTKISFLSKICINQKSSGGGKIIINFI